MRCHNYATTTVLYTTTGRQECNLYKNALVLDTRIAARPPLSQRGGVKIVSMLRLCCPREHVAHRQPTQRARARVFLLWGLRANRVSFSSANPSKYQQKPGGALDTGTRAHGSHRRASQPSQPTHPRPLVAGSAGHGPHRDTVAGSQGRPLAHPLPRPLPRRPLPPWPLPPLPLPLLPSPSPLLPLPRLRP